MTSLEIYRQISDLENEVEKLRKENETLKETTVNAESFDKSFLTVEAVANLHNVHPATVRNYVKGGYIERHPQSTDSKILIRASTALLLNFKELKRAPYSRV